LYAAVISRDVKAKLSGFPHFLNFLPMLKSDSGVKVKYQREDGLKGGRKFSLQGFIIQCNFKDNIREKT
jgi:hypothetical protein